mmetsp:Transcript_54070/g.150374  ORF Transcript_54070/g.150374 Transcript_54070/m.150374 type:complete len:248 (-) Transcript_54070:86-829(-)
MVGAPRRRTPMALTFLVGLAFGMVAWEFVAPRAFVGSAGAAGRGSLTRARGYRLDWMLEGKDGTRDLQTQDGYWLGEIGFEKSQAAQGLRYRMRATSKEIKEGTEVDGHIWQLGPIKVRFGEAFGGSGNNPKLRELKKKIFKAGVSDPKKIAENEYWMKRYGHKRWEAPYVDQSQGTAKIFLRGLAAWSGVDPKKEERGVTWFEADYGKPWIQKYVGRHLEGFVSKEQLEKEYATGKLNALPAPKTK